LFNIFVFGVLDLYSLFNSSLDLVVLFTVSTRKKLFNRVDRLYIYIYIVAYIFAHYLHENVLDLISQGQLFKLMFNVENNF